MVPEEETKQTSREPALEAVERKDSACFSGRRYKERVLVPLDVEVI